MFQYDCGPRTVVSFSTLQPSSSFSQTEPGCIDKLAHQQAAVCYVCYQIPGNYWLFKDRFFRPQARRDLGVKLSEQQEALQRITYPGSLERGADDGGLWVIYEHSWVGVIYEHSWVGWVYRIPMGLWEGLKNQKSTKGYQRWYCKSLQI